jgi:DNA uptake protein ComE-like DNA-binding protein
VLALLNDPALTADGLDAATGIGAVRAEMILIGRSDEGGSFGEVEDVLDITGIGPRTIDKIRAAVAVDDPDDRLLAALNQPGLDPLALAEAAGIATWRARIITTRVLVGGPFTDVAQILALPAIGQGTLSKLRAMDLPAPAPTSLDQRLLDALNAPTTTANLLAENAGLEPAVAEALLAARGPQGFAVIEEVLAVTGVEPSDLEKLRSAGLVGSKPIPPDNPANLEQAVFARAMLEYAFAEDFWSWDVYPGLDSHRVATTPMIGTGIAAARAMRKDAALKVWPFLDAAQLDDRYKTMGTSFFNAPSAAYIHENLYPLATFKEKIVKTGKKVQFPMDSVIVKALFVQIPAGLDTSIMKTVETPSGTMGLVQLDISTKQYSTWTWMTFSYQPGNDPKHFGLGLHQEGGTIAQTGFHEKYYGPVDNPKSSCIACHQVAQFPPKSIGAAVRMNDHHLKRDQPFMTSRGMGIPVDFIWEVTQALKLEEEETGVILDLNEFPDASAITTMGAGDNGPDPDSGSSTATPADSSGVAGNLPN